MKYSELATFLTKLRSDRPMLLVGVDAPGSSGKSTFARRLAAGLGDAQVVCMDDLQGGASDVGSTGWVWIPLEEEVIKPLLRGDQARFHVYDWGTRAVGSKVKVVEPSGIVVVEGLYATRPELRDYYDFRIWVDCPFEVKRQRALARHAHTRTVVEIDSWIAEERVYIELHQPREHAHLIVSGTHEADGPEDAFVVLRFDDDGPSPAVRTLATSADYP